MKLVEYLKGRHPTASEDLILAYIKEGLVKIEGNEITNPFYDVGDRTEKLELVEEHILDKDMDWWCMRKIDGDLLNLNPTNRILGFELRQGHVDYILERKADVVVLNFFDHGLKNYAEAYVGNLFQEDFSPVIRGKFDVILSFVRSNPVRIFGLVENYKRFLMHDSRVAVLVNPNEYDSLKDIKRAFNEAASFVGFRLVKYATVLSGSLVGMLFARKEVRL